jgi:hypothetical protein
LELVSIVGASYGSYLKDLRLERLNESNLTLPDDIKQLLLKKLKSLKSKWIHSLTTFSNQQNLALTLNLEASSTTATSAATETETTSAADETLTDAPSVIPTVDTETNTNTNDTTLQSGNRSSGRKKGNSSSSSSKKTPSFSSSSSSSSITLKDKNSLQYDMKSVMRILIDVTIIFYCLNSVYILITNTDTNTYH